MKTLLFALSLCATSIVFGQTQRQTVAVWVGGKNADINEVIADQLVSAISLSNVYVAVERSADFRRLVQKERGYQASGNVDDGQIATWGKQFGVKLVCVARVSVVAGTNYVSARIINVETAEVYKTANIHSRFENFTAIIAACESLASQLLGIKSRAEMVQEQEAARKKQREEEHKRELLKAQVARGYIVVAGTLYVQTADAATDVSYAAAEEACRKSYTGGFFDWRLPTLEEANRIHSAFTPNELTQLSLHYYSDGKYHCKYMWTSTVKETGTKIVYNSKRKKNEDVPYNRYIVCCAYGISGSWYEYDVYRARCVRGY